MLPLPTGSGTVVFIGIDPGTTFPGVGTIHYDVPSKKIVRASGRVLNLGRMIRHSPYRDHQQERFLKVEELRMHLRSYFKQKRPIKVASEHPFINVKRPGAVIPLAECLATIEQEVFYYDPYLSLEKIDPSSIKKCVGVSGTSDDKHEMTEAIKKIPELMDVLVNDIDSMDNNAVDGLAVAYCSLKRELGPPT